MKVVFYPYGGLANRMRSIDSVVNMCKSDDRLSIVWYKDWGMGCDWNELFFPVDFVYDCPVSKTMRRTFKYYDSKWCVRMALLILKKLHILYFCDLDNISKVDGLKKSWGKYLFCIIRSWEEFCPQKTFHNELFRIKEDFRLNEELSKIDENTVGVHIRRTDNIWSIEHSPLSLFEDRMKKELHRNPLSNFYVCSDDESVKEHFRQDFWKDKVKFPTGVINRTSKEGIVQAACEMYALSATKKIIGSYWSSFGELAAKIGNLELDVVYKK